VDSDKDRTPRVLLVDSGGVGTLGLRDALDAEDFEIETDHATLDEVLQRLTRDETDVVVLDLELEHAIVAAERIAAEHPSVKVIVCSLDEPTMRVFPAWGSAPYEAPLDPDLLAAAVRASE
jgi:DNA-binding NarL/FixJ family response regulator